MNYVALLFLYDYSKFWHMADVGPTLCLHDTGVQIFVTTFQFLSFGLVLSNL